MPLLSRPLYPTPTAFGSLHLLVAVALSSLVAAVCFPLSTQLRERANESHLESVVSRLNRSVDIYHRSGGSFAGLTTAQQVIEKLKRKQDAAARFAGFSGALVADHIQAVALHETEVNSERLRAIWNPFRQCFETTHLKVAGIIRFEMHGTEFPPIPSSCADPETPGSSRQFGTQAPSEESVELTSGQGGLRNHP